MTPKAQGYRMPAEWRPHAATWLSWPHPETISFPGNYCEALSGFVRIIDALAESEAVHLNVRDQQEEDDALALLKSEKVRNSHVVFHHIPTNEPWCRDHGPTFLLNQNGESIALVDWQYNAWGGKYPPFDLDNAVPQQIAAELGHPLFSPGIVMEGGAIEVNGNGTLLTTESCLLNPNRNPSLTQGEIETKLRDFYGVDEILWLGDGIEGDDTDGHIDDLTRFVNETSVVTVVEENKDDSNFLPLTHNLERLQKLSLQGKPLTILTLPMPAPILREGLRLPASYANFYIANTVVLMPAFADPADKAAQKVLQTAFPDREVLAIDCRELIWGLGAIHCLTQQQPAII